MHEKILKYLEKFFLNKTFKLNLYKEEDPYIIHIHKVDCIGNGIYGTTFFDIDFYSYYPETKEKISRKRYMEIYDMSAVGMEFYETVLRRYFEDRLDPVLELEKRMIELSFTYS